VKEWHWTALTVIACLILAGFIMMGMLDAYDKGVFK
jgi:hypothetical protein